MDKKSKKDGGKRWLLWLLLVLILAGVFIWLIVRNNGTSLNIQDLSISSSSKNSISLEIEAEGDGLKYYYSLDGQHSTEEKVAFLSVFTPKAASIENNKNVDDNGQFLPTIMGIFA